jgi:hypothetical protein
MTANSEKFSIDVTGDVTGRPWKGVFETKLRLSHRDQLRQDEIRRELLGARAEHASNRAINQAEIFSTIAAHLTKVPEWWTVNGGGLDLEDDNVIGAVYDRIIELKGEAAKKAKGEADAAKTELAKVKAE